MEIAILAVGIYYILTLLRGTRGAAVITGFLVLLLTLTTVITFLKLEVLTWILGAFSAFFAVAVLVLFQPELRRILAQLGNLQLFNTTQEQREHIEVVVQAAERLSEARIGALMAIEQSIQLHELVESSLTVDCAATPEMLETIFFPNNAIHDGGVVIKGDRIAWAACIFPLSRQQDLRKSLGTRHRAALGLSEECDAVVVVVSEETGAISYAYEGVLHRSLSAAKLREALNQILVRPQQGRSPLAWLKVFARQWGRKELEPSGPSDKA